VTIYHGYTPPKATDTDRELSNRLRAALGYAAALKITTRLLDECGGCNGRFTQALRDEVRKAEKENDGQQR
jgi:hypothetical protein